MLRFQHQRRAVAIGIVSAFVYAAVILVSPKHAELKNRSLGEILEVSNDRRSVVTTLGQVEDGIKENDLLSVIQGDREVVTLRVTEVRATTSSAIPLNNMPMPLDNLHELRVLRFPTGAASPSNTPPSVNSLSQLESLQATLNQISELNDRHARMLERFQLELQSKDHQLVTLEEAYDGAIVRLHAAEQRAQAADTAYQEAQADRERALTQLEGVQTKLQIAESTQEASRVERSELRKERGVLSQQLLTNQSESRRARRLLTERTENLERVKAEFSVQVRQLEQLAQQVAQMGHEREELQYALDTARSDNAQVAAVLAKIKTEFADVTRVRQGLQSERDELVGRLQTSMESLSAGQVQRDDLQERLDGSRELLRVLQARTVKSDQRTEQLDEAHSASQLQVQSLTRDLQAAKARADELAETAVKHETELVTLREQSALLSREADSRRKTLTKVQVDVDRVQSERDRLRETAQILEQERDDTQTQLADTQRALQRSLKDRQRFETRAEDLAATVKPLRRDVKSAHVQVATLETQFEASTTSLASAKADAQRWKAERNELQQRLEHADHAVGKLRKERHETQRSRKQQELARRHEREDLEEQRQQAQTALTDTRASLGERKKQVRQLKEQFDASDRQRTQLEQRIMQVSEERDQALARGRASEEQVEQWQTAATELRDSRDDAAEQVKTLQAQLVESRQAAVASQQHASQLQDMVVSLQRTVDASQVTFEEVAADRDHLKQVEDMFRQRVASLSGGLSAAQADRTLLQQSEEALTHQLQTTQDALTTRTSQRDALQLRLVAMTQDEAQLRQQSTKLQHTIKTVQDTLSRVGDERDQLQQLRDRLRHRLASVSGALSAAEANRAFLKESVRGLTEAMQSAQQALEERTHERDDQQTQLVTLASTLDTRTRERDLLQQERDTLARARTALERTLFEHREDLADRSHALTNAEAERSTLIVELERLRFAIDQSEGQLKALHSQHAEATNALVSTREQLALAETQLVVGEATQVGLEERIETLERTMATTLEARDALATQLAEAASALASTREQLALTDSQRVAGEATQAVLEDRIDSLVDQRDQLATLVAKFSGQRDHFEAQATSEQQRAKALEEQLNVARQEHAQAFAEVRAVADDGAARIVDFEQQAVERSTRIDALTAAVYDATQARDALSEAAELRESQVQTLVKKLQSMGVRT